MKYKKLLILILFFSVSYSAKMHSQSCAAGSSPLPILLETFGSGNNPGAVLPVGITTYTFIAGWPDDGQYAIWNTSDPNNGGVPYWHKASDHTGNPKGYMMVVNAAVSQGEFYRKQITGLCPSTTYVCSMWAANANNSNLATLCSTACVKSDIRINIENAVGGAILNTTTTGNLPLLPTLTWKEYSLSFTLLPGQTAVNFVLVNIAPGGDGNDLVIDDISFKACLPNANIAAPQVCAGKNVTITGTFPGYISPEKQWQNSSDGGATWIDMPGKTSANLILNNVTLPPPILKYRLLVAETGNIGSVNCRTISNEITLNIVPTPTVNISSQTNVLCNGGNNGSATTTPSGGTGAYTYLWNTSPAQTGASATGLTAGTYTINVMDVNGCPATNTVAITQPTIGLSATISAQTNVLCNGGNNGSATTTPSGGTGAYTYLWNTTPTQTGANATGLTTGVYVVNIKDANGCQDTKTVTISQPTSPTIAAVSNVLQAACGNNTGSAVASSSGGTPGYFYLWSPGGMTSQNITGLAAGVYTVTVTDMNGCTDTEIANVTNADGPKVTTSINANVLCYGEITGSATAIPTGGLPTYTYLWGNGQTTQTATGLAAGTQIVTVTDSIGCVAFFTAVISQPTFSLSATVPSQTNVSCNGWNNGEATADASGGTPGYTFLWNNGQTTKTATGLSKGYYTVNITDGNGCTITTSVSISEPPVLAINTSSQTNILCNGGNNGDATVNPIGGTPGYTFLWNDGQTTQTATGLASGNYSITITDNNGCTTAASFTLSQPAISLSSSVSQSDVSCNGGNNATATLIPIGGTPGYTFLWNNGQTTETVSGLTAGSYTVNITDANGCIATTSVTISEPAVLTTIASDQTNVSCNGGINGDATANPIGGILAYTFLWNDGQTTQTATGLTAGSYTADITDANGCKTATSVTILEPAVLTTTASVQTNVSCNGGINGDATANVSGGTKNYSYLWNTGQTTFAITGIIAGNYSVVITDANKCTLTHTFSITQPDPILLSLSGNDSICPGEISMLNATSTGGTPAYTYVWMPGSQSGQSISVSPVLSTTYAVTTTDANGCSSITQTFSVSVLPIPTALFNTVSSGVYSSVFSFSDLSSGGVSWLWDFGDGSTSTLQNPIHTFPNAGIYTVTQMVFNQFGCQDTFKIMVDFNDGIIIPNVFTPDGDGVNDVWYIPNSGMKEFHVDIYDRWGLKVFETTSDEIRWDGRTGSGILLTDGTYYFVLKAVLKSSKEDKDYSTKGHITLLTQKRK